MPQEVELDDQILEFPDDMTQDDIRSVLREKFPEPRTTKLPEALSKPKVEIPYQPGMPYGTPPPVITPPQTRTTTSGPQSTSTAGQFISALNPFAQTEVSPAGEAAQMGRERMERAGVSPEQRTQAADEIKRRFGARIAAFVPQTESPNPEARRRAEGAIDGLQQQQESELANLGVGTAKLFGTAQLPRTTEQDVTRLTGITGRPARAMAAAQGAVMGLTESFATPEGMSMVIPGAGAAFAKAFIPMMVKDAVKLTGEAAGHYSAGDSKAGDEALLNAGAIATMLGIPLAASRGRMGARELEGSLKNFKLEDRGDVAAEIFNRFEAQRQAEAGSPFVRLEAPASKVSMGVRTQPTLGAEPTFDPRSELLGGPGTWKPGELGRPLEAPLQIERTPDAILKESTEVPGNVRQPEVAQQGAGQVPVTEGRPQAAEARVATTLEADKALYNQITERMTTLVRAGDINSPLLEVLKGELEVVKNRHGGMPPGQTSPARQTVTTGIANEIQPAVRIGGKVISSPDKGHIAMALEVGGADAIRDVSKPENQGFLYKGEFISRDAASQLLGEKTPMTTEALLEIRKSSEKEAPKTLEQRLEDLKFKQSGELGAELHALRPDILQRVGKQLWNDAIDAAVFAIRAGKTVAQAIDAALAHIRKTRSGLDEAPMRAELNRILNPERETTVFPTEGESTAMRKSAERATTSPMIPEPVQEQIRTAPESTYTQQSMKRVEETVSGMSDTELSTVPRDSNLYTAAKLEQANRLFKAGKNDAGYDVFVELEKEGTRLGQLINQFKLLKGTRPEDVVRVINTTLRKAGKDPLNKAQEKTGLETSKKAKDADKALDEATTEWEKNPTPENAAKAEKALLESNAAALELQRFVGKFSPRSTAGIIKSVLQGNLLTPISQTANIVGNMMNVPFRAATRTVATSLDILDNYLTGRAREISVSPVRGTVEAGKGLARGAAKIPDVLLRGSGDTIKGETRAGLHPIQAWINQFSKNPEMPTTGGKLTPKDRINLLIEGTFGVPAEAMLRGLGAGDVAFREAARARTINSELELANVPREQRGFAQKFPELFLDEAALKRIHDSTLSAIFQQPSKLLNMFTGWLRGKGEWWDLAAATVAPYKLTPWNIIGEILSYSPLIATAKTINNARIGNRRQAKIDAGKLVVGTALTAAGWWLYKNQLMSPSLDQRDEEQKARILAGEVLPPNHINISGLKRKLAGGDPTFKKGDETRDVFRAGGLAGSMFYMTANIGRQFERSPEVPESEAWGALLRQSTLEQARFGMNQSFLQGVEGLLSAVREGNADSYIQRWGNTVASIPLPNSLTVMSRASREYKPDLREDTFRNQMENIVKNRLGVAGLDDYLPLKRGLWGEPMKETPEGRNAIMYHFFDVFKGKQVTSDPVPLELYRLWRKTTDTRVIPSLPEKVLTVGGQQYPLTAEQQSRYAELVGQTRRKIVDAIVVNPEFHKLPDEKKIDLLDRVYRAGQQGGKAQFWKESGASLTPKPSRAGFQQPVLQP